MILCMRYGMSFGEMAMSRFIRFLFGVSLCFVLICQLCGVGFASEVDGSGVPASDPFLETFENWSLPPDAYISEEPVVSDPPELPSTDVTLTLPPALEVEESLPPVIETDPPWAPLPGGDTPAYDYEDLFGEPSAAPVLPAGDDPLSSGGVGDGTYIVLPDDFVIQSAGYDDAYAIDPYSLAPVTPSNTTGLKSVLVSILGNYDPIVAQYQYNNGSNYSYIREIQPDYVWLVSAGIFAILLYCTWRLLGGLICKM